MQKVKSLIGKKTGVRAWELDALRGLAILSVVWDHVMYDLAYMFYYEWQYLGADGLLKASEFARTYHDGFLRVLGWPFFVFIFSTKNSTHFSCSFLLCSGCVCSAFYINIWLSKIVIMQIVC